MERTGLMMMQILYGMKSGSVNEGGSEIIENEKKSFFKKMTGMHFFIEL
jgi:hypothetical protein